MRVDIHAYCRVTNYKLVQLATHFTFTSHANNYMKLIFSTLFSHLRFALSFANRQHEIAIYS